MSVRTDNTSDKVQGSCPAIGTGQFSWGFWWRPASTSDGQIGWIDNAASPGASGALSIEISTLTVDMFTTGFGSTGGYTFANGTFYYILISRATSASVRMRIYTSSSTPVFDQYTGGDSSAVNLSLPNRGYGTLGSNVAQDQEFESEKWELGVEWSDAEAWAEAQKYALQRVGGTAEIQCDMTTVNADATGLNDVAGTAQNLTNTGCVTGTNHPSALETLGGGANTDIETIYTKRSRPGTYDTLLRM